MSTADDTSAKIVGYDPLGAGSGVAQAQRATTTAALALTNDHLDSLAFGYRPLDGAFSDVESFTIVNKGSKQITYNLAAGFIGGKAGAKVKVDPSQVTGAGSPVARRRCDTVALHFGGRGTADRRDVRWDGPGRRSDGGGRGDGHPDRLRHRRLPLHVPFCSCRAAIPR